AVVADPAFTADPFRIHTRWIETEFVNEIKPFTPAGTDTGTEQDTTRERVVVEVGGHRLEVSLPAVLAAVPARTPSPAGAARPRRRTATGTAAPGSGNTLTSPMQGTVVKVAVEEGQEVQEGDLIVVLEAMKMEQPLTAHKSGTVTRLTTETGQTLSAGAAICDIKD
ncbi:biotin/lipoyl-containing protein, partial [Streptomyces sp. NPDC048389]|uniref:biotin/lipoyl-containing protein n=1 Tax=Streptomyces sp. NPDC048389 TaxID=3154622 RepID=UPI003456299B